MVTSFHFASFRFPAVNGHADPADQVIILSFAVACGCAVFLLIWLLGRK